MIRGRRDRDIVAMIIGILDEDFLKILVWVVRFSDRRELNIMFI